MNRIAGFDNLEQADQKVIMNAIREFSEKRASKIKSPTSQAKKDKTNPRAHPEPSQAKKDKTNSQIHPEPSSQPESARPASLETSVLASEGEASEAARKDNNFRVFRRICAEIADVSAYSEKSARLNEFLSKGTTGGTPSIIVFSTNMFTFGRTTLTNRIYRIRYIVSVPNVAAPDASMHFCFCTIASAVYVWLQVDSRVT